MSQHTSIQICLMDISLNLARIGDWIDTDYRAKDKLIQLFLQRTETYINNVAKQTLSPEVQKILLPLQREFGLLKKQKITETNKDAMAEKALTWANILQHRAKLA